MTALSNLACQQLRLSQSWTGSMAVSGTSAVQLRTLGEIAEVLPGFSSGHAFEHDPQGIYQLIQSRHLTPGMPYSYNPTDRFLISAPALTPIGTPRSPKPRDLSKYEVVHGDVLFMSRGTRNVASWIETVPHHTIAPVSFYVIRPKPVVDSGYLCWFLNQPAAQRAISDIRTGAGTPIVQRGAFVTVAVPIPDAETQRRISELSVQMIRERMMIEQLTHATTRAHNVINESLARDLLSRASSEHEE